MKPLDKNKVNICILRGQRRTSYTFTLIIVLSLSFFMISGIFDFSSMKNDSLELNSKPVTSFVTVMEDWNRTWGGSNNDYGEDIVIDQNGDIICAGHTYSFSMGQNDVCLVKYNELGDQLWNTTWGGGSYDTAQAIATDSLGNIYITGYTSSYGEGGNDFFLLKYTISGSFQWYRTFGGSASDLGRRIALDSFGNIYILGTTESFGSGSQDICLVKYNNSGNQEWYRTWGGSSSEHAYAIIIDSQNNIYLGGDTYNGGYDLFLMKYNTSGNQLWTELLDASEWDSCHSLAFDSNEDIICGGNMDTRPGPQTVYQILMLKYDKNGYQLWNNTWTSANSVSIDTMALDSSDNIYIGFRSYGSHMVKFNQMGYYEWDLLWGIKKGDLNLDNQIRAIRIDSLDTFYIAGSEYNMSGNAWELSITKYRDALFAVSINSSHPENLFRSTPPQFNITIFEPDIDTTWYSLNGGKDFVFTGTTGTIIQTEWDSCDEGLIFINFYANNSQGYTVSHGIQVIKDTLVPVIEILKPLPDQPFGDSIIEFELNITEANLISTWYNLNDGNNITINSSNGTIDQASWNHCEVGPVKVSFFVSDIAENVISQEIYLNHTDELFGEVILSRFIVDNNGGGTYTWEEATLRSWCNGSGTLVDPYIIASIEIDGQGAGNGLEIRDSDIYFRIENSSFYNAGDAGLKLVNVSNGVIYNNEINNNDNRGLYLNQESDHNVIEHNIIRNNRFYGVYLYRYCDYNLITNNLISGNQYAAIRISDRCTYNDVINNENSGDIQLHLLASHNNISRNTASSMTFQDYCEYNIVWQNIISGGGDRGIIFVSGWCKYNNFKENIVKDSGVNGFFFIWYCDSNTVEKNVLFHNDGWAVSLVDYCDGNSIRNNAFIENDDNGVYIKSNCLGNTISGNAINEDLYENNDAFGTAVLISSESTHYLAARDNDWFKTYINRGYTLEIGITRASLKIELYNLSGHLLTSSTGSSLSYNVITSGYYYIKISLFDYSYVMSLNTLDAGPPIITVFAPFEGGFYNDTAPLFDVEIYDLDLDSMWYSLNYGANYTFTTNLTCNSIEWENLPEGQIKITFFANDTLGYEASKTVQVYKDIHIPIVKVLSPIQSQLLGLAAPAFIVEIRDLYLDTMWYTLDGGLTNIIFTENGTFDPIEWNKLMNGSITIIFFANDSIGNLVFSSVKCWFDGYLPSITMNYPLENQIFGNSPPYFDVDIDDANLDTKWYSINSGSKIIFTNLTGMIKQEAWESCGNGTVLITFFANDTAGNLAFHEILIYKDIIAPEITIMTPLNNLLSGYDTFSFNLSINERNFDSSWYCLNNGINHTFIGMTGMIDQEIWDSFGNGSVILRFYANDTLGNLAFKEVSVRKDIISPIITIIIPTQDGIFGLDAPNFNLLINENNLDQIWYTINHIVSNLPCDRSGQIAQNFWDLVADGEVQIEFYANDTLGNIGTTSVTIIKDTTLPTTPEPNIIPGYSIISILSVLCLILIILIKKNFKK